jgi:multidrug resistance protein, MATE family
MQNTTTSTSISKEFKHSAAVSFPMIVSQAVYALNGFIATMFIAHLGKDELATNALVWGIYITLILFFFGVLSAVSIVTAERHGAKDFPGMQNTLNQGIILAFFTAIPTIIILIFGANILAFFGQNETIVNLSRNYFYSLASGILPIYVIVIIQQFLLGMGRTKLVLFIGIMEVPMQLVCFYVFIFGHWHMPAFGLSGIGIGITFVVALWAIIMSFYLRFSKKYCEYKIFSNILSIDKRYFLELLKVGLPLGFMYSIEVGLFAACAFLMGYFGKDMLAAHQIAYQCFVFAVVIVFGFSQGTTVRVSNEVGRNDKNTLLLSFYVHLIMCFCFAFLCAVIYFVFAEQIIGIDIDVNLSRYSAVTKQAKTFLQIISVLLIVESLRAILIGVMRGLKQTKTIMYISLITFWLIAFPLAYLLGFILPFQGAGIWWGITIGAICATLMLWIKFSRVIATIDLKSLHV